MIHEQEGKGPEAFCIDHFKPRSKGGRVNHYPNLYWSCIPCNRFKGDQWPTAAQRRRGIRFADPCREWDYGVHFVENDFGELIPQTPCGEYHVTVLRLNLPWLCRQRRQRNAKQQRLAEALALQRELENALAEETEPESSQRRRLLAFVQDEIELLQAELAIAIPFIPRGDDEE
jgi:hypothetical protein